MISIEDLERQRELLEKLGLSLKASNLDAGCLLQTMHRDKKVEKGHIRFVLPTGIGTQPALKAIQDKIILHELEAEGYAKS
jgi:3-dehydroquinate synthase